MGGCESVWGKMREMVGGRYMSGEKRVGWSWRDTYRIVHGKGEVPFVAATRNSFWDVAVAFS